MKLHVPLSAFIAMIYIAMSFIIAPQPAEAKSKPRKIKTSAIELRAIKDSSVDVFDVLAHIPKADTAFAQGNYALALQHYRYVYLHDPKQDHVAMGYADAALALGQTAIAKKIYKDFAITNNRAKSGLLLTCVLEKTLKDPEVKLRAQLETASDDARLWNMLGQILDANERGSEARQAYAMAQLAGQRAGLASNNIGQSFLKEQNLEAALREFTQASFDAPQNRLFDNNRRLTLLLQKDYIQALRQLDKSRASQLLKDAGLIVARQGETKLAKYFLEKSIWLNPVYDESAAQYLEQLSGRLSQ